MILASTFLPENSRTISTELLLAKGYQVHGVIRRSSSFNTGRLHHLYEDQHERTFPRLRYSHYHLMRFQILTSSSFIMVILAIAPISCTSSHRSNQPRSTILELSRTSRPLLKWRNILRTSMASVHYVFLMRFVPVDSRNMSVFTKHRLQSFTVKLSKHLKAKLLLSTLDLLMAARRCTLTGSQ